MKISMGTLSYPNTRLSIIFALCVQSVAEICTFLNFEFEQIFLFVVYGAILYYLIFYNLDKSMWYETRHQIHQQNWMNMLHNTIYNSTSVYWMTAY